MTDDYVSDLRAFCTEWLKQNQGCDLIDHGFGGEHGGELTTVKLIAALDELEKLRDAVRLEREAFDMRGARVAQQRAELSAAWKERDAATTRAETAERELAEMREFIGDAKVEWASDTLGFFFTTPFSTEDDMRRHVREVCEKGGDAVLKQRLVGEWRTPEKRTEEQA